MRVTATLELAGYALARLALLAAGGWRRGPRHPHRGARGSGTSVRVPFFLVLAATVLVARPEWPSPAGQTPATAVDEPHVVLLSVDGLVPRSYRDPTVREAPTLQRLAREGAYADGVIGVLPSVTYPSHTTLITGVPPALHGIYDNRLVDPENLSRGAWRWYARQIRVPTLIGAATARGLRTGAVYWPVTVGMHAAYLLPEFWRSDHPEGLELLRVLSRPPTLLDAVEIARGRPLEYPLTDEGRLDIALFILRTVRPHLLVVHLIELDGAQHARGPDSSEARAALARIDGYVARLLAALEAAGLRAATDLFIVSDHGFAPIARQLQPNALFKQEGLLTVDRDGAIVRWRAYFHSAGGSGYVYLSDPTDTALRGRVRALLDGLAADPANGVEAVWDAAALRVLGAHPEAAFGLGMRPGFYTAGGHDALLVPTTSRGGHGFAPTRPDMHASLIAVGPHIARRGSLGIVRMTQIAPSLARLLDVGLSVHADRPIDGLLAPSAASERAEDAPPASSTRPSHGRF